MSDMEGQTSEPELQVLPSIQAARDKAADPNYILAMESAMEEEEFVECPTCHHQRRAFLIVDDKCDSCRTKDEHSKGIVPELGWPEVRQKRTRLLEQSDSTQLADRSLEVKEAFLEWRQSLRDITDQECVFKAWARLDELEANRPSG